MEVLEARAMIFDQGEIARAGVFGTLDRDGRLAIYRAEVRREDWAAVDCGGVLGVEEQGIASVVLRLPAGTGSPVRMAAASRPLAPQGRRRR